MDEKQECKEASCSSEKMKKSKNENHNWPSGLWCQPSLVIILHSIQPRTNTSPKPTFLLLLLLLKFSINNLQRRIAFWHSRCQILIPILRNQDIILDPDTTDGIIFVKKILIDVFCVLGIFEVDFFEGVAGEITVEKVSE
jgi:hypothetical protein